MTNPKSSHTGFNYSRLYTDFLAGIPAIDNYLRGQNAASVIDRKVSSGIDRDIMCDILEKQNRAYGAGQKTFDALDLLRNKDALCIFSGQQAGLFTGPLYTLYKAIDIIKRAEKLTERLKRPVVPVFWIATDDHDFEEINHTYSVNREGIPDKIVYDAAPESPVPVADICFDNDDAYDKLRQQAGDAFGGTDYSDELMKRLFGAYKSENCFGFAFARYMADILPDLGLIMFCPSDKGVKAISKSFFKRLVETYFLFKPLLEKTAASLERDGYHIQVKKKRSAVHMFYNDPQRLPIHYLDDLFHIGEKRLALPAMLDLIERNPDRFSPDVLTRPLWQSYLFPVIAQTGGPSEIAYFCQIGRLFELFNFQQPIYYPRLSATIIEKRAEYLFDKYGFSPDDLFGDVEQLINRIASQSFPEEIKKRITEFRLRLHDNYEDLMRFLLEYDKNLETTAKQTYGKIDFAMSNLEKKMFAQHKNKMEDVRGQIYRLAGTIWPDRQPQERILNINYFISKYGFGIVDFIVKKLDSETGDNQIIRVSEFTK